MYTIKSLGRGYLNRIARTLRGGNDTRFTLSTGRKIKRHNTATPVDDQDIITDSERIAEAITGGIIELCKDGEPMSAEDVLSLVGKKKEPKPVVDEPEVAEPPSQEAEEDDEGSDASEEPESDDSGETPDVYDPETQEEDESTLSEEDLKAMKRAELDELAELNGLSPSKYGTKGALIEAILNLEG